MSENRSMTGAAHHWHTRLIVDSHHCALIRLYLAEKPGLASTLRSLDLCWTSFLSSDLWFWLFNLREAIKISIPIKNSPPTHHTTQVPIWPLAAMRL